MIINISIKNYDKGLFPLPKELECLETEPSIYVVALAESKTHGLSVNKEAERTLHALAMHSQEQIEQIHECAARPDSKRKTDIARASTYHEGGGCNNCRLELSATAKLAFCPICGKDIYLT